MPRKHSLAAPPRLEALEDRLTPSGISESFDSTAAGALPAGWAQWSSSGSAAFAVSSARALSAPNGLAVTSPGSRLDARSWVAASQPADVQASAAVYLNSPIPALVLARGSNLDTPTPTYYAASLSYGLNLSLVRVVNGVSTTLGQVGSANWVANQWARLTLYVDGASVRAEVTRADNGQYLNSSGQWQASPAWALNLSDSAISGAGQVGLGRPSSYAGTVAFDDFAASALTAESQPPSVTLTAPGSGATLSGVVSVQASATDNVGVARVEFYVDGVLRAVTTQAPYTWSFDTTDVSNGTHTISAVAYDAAENFARASLTVTTSNDLSPLPLPSIPQHYDNIRIADLAYGNIGLTEDSLLQSSVDLAIVDSPPGDRLSQINSVAPDTPQLLYTNVSSVYRSLLTDWLSYADAHGLNREEAFYHVAAATPFAGNSPSSQPVNWFWAVFRGSSSLSDLTWPAHDPSSREALGAAGESFYVGYPEKFREINLNLASGAAGGWGATLEYPNAVDASGKPTSWAPLTTLTNTTAGWTQSGQVTFDPPADWKPASVGGSTPLYYVRIRTTSAGTAPVANTVLGRDYVGANGTSAGVIPAFDSSADLNHDGYLDDSEYAHRTPGMDARFVYESRAFYGSYGQMRFATDPSDLGFKSWAVDYSLRTLASQPLADGLFVDNSGGASPFTAGSVLEPVGAYTADYASLLYQIGRAIEPRWLMANTSGGVGSSADVVASKVQSYFEEFLLRPLAQTYQQFEGAAALVARRAGSAGAGPLAVLDSTPAGGSPTDPRTQLATLADYYLLADPQTTFLDFYGGSEPGSSWDRHWSPAAAYDIGQPTGTWSVFASGSDPANPALTYRVYQRRYTGALVLYRPLSVGNSGTGTLADSTATTFALDGVYYPLQADGTLGPAVQSVTLRNGEGAILVKAPPPTLGIGDVSVIEGNSGTVSAVFTVTLSAPASYPITVSYATADGTASSINDYAATSGTLTFAPGVTSLTIPVTVFGDRIVEKDETFFINLSGVSAGAALGRAQGVGTILNDDSGTPNAVYVASFSSQQAKANQGYVTQLAAVVLRDSNGNGVADSGDAPAAGVTVTFAVTGPVSLTVTATTDSTGTARTSWLANLPPGTYTARITGLTHQTFVWDKALDPKKEDSDGDGLPDIVFVVPAS